MPDGDRKFWMKPRYWIILFCVTAGCVVAMYILGRFEQFLISSSRFTLAGPPEPGDEVAGFRAEGIVHASHDRVVQAFARDFGRSVYLLPVAERRRNLLAVNWIEDASVTRLWPNGVRVRVRERRPVAFVQFSNDDVDPSSTPRPALIDREGVILYPQAAAQFELPVVLGISPAQSEADRRYRMRRVTRLIDDLGPLAEAVSEIDVADPENLRAVQQVDDRAVTLILGNQRFKQRVQNFLANYPEIRRRLPDAVLLDLRLEDRITAVPVDAESRGHHGR
jgi:cell division protein FtsQ